MNDKKSNYYKMFYVWSISPVVPFDVGDVAREVAGLRRTRLDFCLLSCDMRFAIWISKIKELRI